MRRREERKRRGARRVGYRDIGEVNNQGEWNVGFGGKQRYSVLVRNPVCSRTKTAHFWNGIGEEMRSIP